MYPWSPLNGRQLALLARIGDGTDPVTSDSPELAPTVRALKERRLVTMPRQGGKWQAEITDAGRFFLEHGHHPDRPEPAQRKQRLADPEQRTRTAPSPQKQAAAPSTTKPAPQRAAKPSQPSPAEVGAASQVLITLIKEWCAKERHRKVAVTIAGDSIEITGRPDTARERMVREFPDRVAGDDASEPDDGTA
ncbi:hypothetical protein OG292_16660 [Streptomyces sp. NBC_01511]|uniref:hypothetical protein n=1 Tax=unclassified Streptomyces TaxID=2593676 RepID=UPI00386D67E6